MFSRNVQTSLFHGSGAEFDTEKGGAEPLLLPNGFTESELIKEEVRYVSASIKVDADVNDLDEEVIKIALAEHFNICVSQISLDLSAGSAIASYKIRFDYFEIKEPMRVATADASALSVALGRSVTYVANASLTTGTVTTTRVKRQPCPRGYWCTAGIQVPCEVGFFNPGVDANNGTACQPCPWKATTRQRGSTSIANCVCQSGYYNHDLDRQVDCRQCIVGISCENVGNVRRRLKIIAGYWRPENASLDIRRCPDAGHNCSRRSDCVHTSSGCHMDGSGPCLPGLKGPFCQLCVNTTNTYYKAADGQEPAGCLECADTLASTIGIASAFIAVALVVAIALWRLAKRPCIGRLSTFVYEAFTLHNKLKILAGFYMIAARVDKVYEVRIPSDMRDVYDTMTRVVTLGINVGLEVTPLDCVQLNGYFWRLVFWMALPIGLSASIVVGSWLWLVVNGRGNQANVAKAAAPLLLRLLFLMYPIVTREAFEAFSYFNFRDDDVAWLRADVSIERGSREDARARSLAVIAIIAYPLGLLVLFGALLFRARHAIRMAQPSALSTAISFLHREYDVKFFYWELFEMLRRFVLVGVLVVFPAQGTVEQLAYGALFSIIYLAFQVAASPFRKTSDNALAVVCSLLLAVLFICLVFYKYGEFTDLQVLQAVMSVEQKNDFDPALDRISLILGAVSIGAIVVLALIIVVQGAEQGRQAILAQQASKMQRLRYVHNKKIVIPPRIPTGSYHVFLSHTWAQVST